MENKKVVETLNDLIAINNDRIEGYEKAIEELEEIPSDNAQTMFLERIQESRVLGNELSAAVMRLGGEPDNDTTASGKLYRTWMGLKTSFTGGSAKSVFELCEYGEDSALKAYDQALEERSDWPTDVQEMITRQRQIIQEAHDTIKEHRDRLEHV